MFLGGVSALVEHSLCIVWSYNPDNVISLNQASAAMAFVAGCHLSSPYYGLHYHGLHSCGPIMYPCSIWDYRKRAKEKAMNVCTLSLNLNSRKVTLMFLYGHTSLHRTPDVGQFIFIDRNFCPA